MTISPEQIAIVLLCYADYESLEISLAAYTKLTPENVKIFILQNGRGTYDTERTYRVAKRYADLFPRQIEVVDWIAPQKPYLSIKQLLNSDVLKPYDYICKVDDDVFPLTSNWLNRLSDCYEKSHKRYGNQLAYVTGLVNNNPWGFPRVLDLMGLKDAYFKTIARDHYVGLPSYSESAYYINDKSRISDECAGTIWRNPYMSRWLHEQSTMKPDAFIQATTGKEYEEVSNKERYSINCMFFKRDFWNQIDIGHTDDEHQTLVYCKKHNKKIIADLQVPMVHLFFCTQREENKDIIPMVRDYYQKWLDIPFPISMCPLKEYENENRLRWIEQRINDVNCGLAWHITRQTQLYSLISLYKKYKYKLLSKVTFGKRRKKYKKKYKELKRM